MIVNSHLLKLQPAQHVNWCLVVAFFLLLMCLSNMLIADSISDFDRYAWSESSGWLNFKSSHQQVRVFNDHLEGYVWAENIGWIRLGIHIAGGHFTYSNDSADSYGVNNDGLGNLSGYGWGENIGWVNFNPSNSQVTIDSNSGDFNGYAWAENIGWIHFKNKSPDYKVKRVLNLLTDIPPAVDLTQNGVLTELQNSPSVAGNNNAINLQQNAQTGNISASVGNRIFSLRPIIIETAKTGVKPGISVSEDGLVTLVSEQGKQLSLLPEPLQIDELNNHLTNRSLKSEQQAFGMLKVSSIQDGDSDAGMGAWYATRTSYDSNPAENEAVAGLSSKPANQPANTLLYEYSFNQNGVLYQQILYPTPADWNRLKDYLQSFGTVRLNIEGLITVQIGNITYQAIMDYRVEPSSQRLAQVVLSAIADINGDGMDDYHVIYPNGDTQILYLIQAN